MKPKRIVRSGDPTEILPISDQQVEWVLNEIARLYRERFRALYNGDQPTLALINEEIALLKSKLPKTEPSA